MKESFRAQRQSFLSWKVGLQKWCPIFVFVCFNGCHFLNHKKSPVSTEKIQWNHTMQMIQHCLIFLSLSHRQIAFLGPLEWRYLFGPKNKVSSHEKSIFRSGVQFLFLFVLTDAILLKLDLQKRTLILDTPPNGKLFVYQKCIIYPKIENVFLIFNGQDIKKLEKIIFFLKSP